MPGNTDHRAFVRAWMAQVATGLPSERLVPLFEQAFGALWRRAHQTLGDVTLTAIVDRVIFTAAEQYPILSVLEIEPTGIDCQELHSRAAKLPRDKLAEGIELILVEYLAVLGHLTAEILTPPLHAELAKVAQAAEGGAS